VTVHPKRDNATHGTNAYDIQLYTLLTVDEFGSGCPVACCFSNRSDELIFRQFFNVVKSKVGQIQSKVFMSDDAPAFYNAWSSVWVLLHINLGYIKQKLWFKP